MFLCGINIEIQFYFNFVLKFFPFLKGKLNIATFIFLLYNHNKVKIYEYLWLHSEYFKSSPCGNLSIEITNCYNDDAVLAYVFKYTPKYVRISCNFRFIVMCCSWIKLITLALKLDKREGTPERMSERMN